MRFFCAVLFYCLFLNPCKNSFAQDSVLTSESETRIDTTNIQLLQSQYASELKTQKIKQLEAEQEAARNKRNLIFFYVLTLCGISFTAAIVFYLESNKNKLLLKKEKESEARVSKFFENITHELRTPLSLISGPLELLSDRVSLEDKKIVEMAQKSSDRLLNLVNQILDLAKIDAGKYELTVKKENIIPVIKGVFYSFKNYAHEKEITLNCSTRFNSYLLYFNAEMIEKIIQNITSNALKFTPKHGQISLTIDETIKKNQTWFRIVIRDNGIGISAENLPYIFNRYYQIGKKERSKWEGTGIGLSLVKELIELQGGSIDVKSKLNYGTEFTILLVAGHQQTESVSGNQIIGNNFPKISVLPYEKDKADDTSENKKSVLIVDDDADTRLYLKSILENNYVTYEAEEGNEGYEMVKKINPNLIICDLLMPNLNGVELCRKVKNDKKTFHIPIIVLTASNSSESKIESLKSKTDWFLTKPFNSKELMAVVETLIDKQKKYSNISSQTDSSLQLVTVSDLISDDKKLLEKLTLIIEDNLSNENFGVKELSNAAGYSRSQLHRKIKQLTNEPPNAFIRNYRLIKGYKMLQSNAGNVAEVCYKVGFSSPSYFTKCFTARFGYSPLKLKQNQPEYTV